MRWLMGSILLTSICIVTLDAWIEYNAKDRLYCHVEDIPKNKVGLILGTSKYSKHGQNLFYSKRVQAAYDLWKAGRIEYLLISGDNATVNYNEPKTFRADLIKKGIPSNRIVLDFAGFRTLDSVVRSKEVFQEEKITIISQQFHNERAIFIADFKGVEAIGFNAGNVGGDGGLAVKLRERLARMKMMLDLLLGKEPKFLGDKITIG
jgi:SanA protein